MSNEELEKNGVAGPGNRKLPLSKYPEKSQNYSPSATFNYNPATGLNGNQHPRRRNDRFRRETLNYTDKLVRQNDLTIRILKEIRDRLPAPPSQPQKVQVNAEQSQEQTIETQNSLLEPKVEQEPKTENQETQAPEIIQ